MNIDVYRDNITSKLDYAIKLNKEALACLYKIRDVNPFKREEFTNSQLECARYKTEELHLYLKRLYKEIIKTIPTYRPLDLIITASSKALQVSESLELILLNLQPLSCFECEFISIYEASLIDLQLAYNNLIIAAKLSLIK